MVLILQKEFILTPVVYPPVGTRINQDERLAEVQLQQAILTHRD